MDALQNIPPLVLAAGAIGAAIGALLLLISRRSGLLLIALMLAIASIGQYADEITGAPVKYFIQPLPVYRAQLFAAAGGMSFAWIIGHWKLIKINEVPPQMIVLIIMGYYAALIRTIHDGPLEGGFSIAFTTLTLLPLGLLLPALLDNERNWLDMLRLLALTSGFYIFLVAVQFVINKDVMMRPPQNRFCGLSGNPQSVAITFAVYSVVSLWLVLFDPKKRYRLLWACLLGVQLIFLAWTGSRTGAGMTAVGMMVAFYRRLGRFVLLAPVGLVAAYLVYDLFLAGAGVELVTYRLISTDNTRTADWMVQWHQFMSSPIIGVGVTDTESENSYLYALSAFGVFMGMMVIFLAFLSAILCLKLFLKRSMLPTHLRPYADLVLSYNALYFAGGFFEGYMIARVGTHIIFMAIFSAVMLRLLQYAQPAVSWAEQEQTEQGWREYAEYGQTYGDDADNGRAAALPA